MTRPHVSFLLGAARRVLTALAPASALLVRLAIGTMFAQTGWGKLQHLERTAGFFQSLGIPAPGFHAVLVGNVELIGGVLLILGLLTRLAALPLLVTMVVAIVTAMLPDVEGIFDLITLDETIYLTVLFLLVTNGAGSWSLDQWLLRRLSSATPGETEMRSSGEAPSGAPVRP